MKIKIKFCPLFNHLVFWKLSTRNEFQCSLLQVQKTRIPIRIQHTQHGVVLGHLQSGYFVFPVDGGVVATLIRVRSSCVSRENTRRAARVVHWGVGLRMSGLVSDLLWSLTKTPSTELTLERFQASMDSFMLIEMRLLCKSFGTKSTGVRSFLKVNSVVLLESSSSLESLSALRTFVASHLTTFVSMTLYLIGGEFFGTEIAFNQVVTSRSLLILETRRGNRIRTASGPGWSTRWDWHLHGILECHRSHRRWGREGQGHRGHLISDGSWQMAVDLGHSEEVRHVEGIGFKLLI